MFNIVSAAAAVLFAYAWGSTRFGGAVLFAALGFYCFSKVAGIKLRLSTYTYFVLFVGIGALGDIAAELSADTGGITAAWFFFLPTLGVLFFSGSACRTARKILAVLYTLGVMLLHLYAAGGEISAHAFLSMELAGLFAAICGMPLSRKRKNDA